MDDNHFASVPWLPNLMDQVQQALTKLSDRNADLRPALEHERAEISEKFNGWTQSLANPKLDSAVRAAVETEYAKAMARQQEIDSLLVQQNARKVCTENLIRPNQVLERLERLPEVLAANNPTLGNLELSLYIDRIRCYSDGKVVMRTCKLGTLPEAIDLIGAAPAAQEPAASDSAKSKPRRRTRLRVDNLIDDERDLPALREFAANAERFSGLGEEWFWIDTFQIPSGPESWAARNAEAVYKRRQEGRLSFAKLGDEFGVTGPTARHAVNHFLKTHPQARDEVRLRGGGRKPKIDVTQFADEARQLWEADCTKLELAKKFNCSTPVIDKALEMAYAENGLSAPTAQDRRQAKIKRTRGMLDDQVKTNRISLDEIVRELHISSVTVRQYLRESYEAEGKPMPIWPVAAQRG